MAIITQTPLPVAPLGDLETAPSYTWPNSNGPFKIGSNLYVLLSPEDGEFYASVYKSSDDGVTWVEQDASNRPHNVVVGGPQSLNCKLASDGSTLVCSYTNWSPGYSFFSFDTDTDTFDNSIPDLIADVIYDADMVVFADGTIKLFTSIPNADPSSASMDIAYYEYDGSSWGSAVRLTNTPSYPNIICSNVSVVVDSSDVIHIYFTSWDNSPV